MKRRRSLGSTAAEHSARATAYVQNTREAAARATKAAARGQCAVAFHEIVVMNRQWSAAIQEHRGAGWGRKFPNKVSDRVESAQGVFERNCVASTVRGRPSGPPRLTLVNGARKRRRR